MKETWLVVADSTRARIFVAHGGWDSLRERTDLVHPLGRAPDRELTSDAPGRAFDIVGEGRHAMAPRTDPKKHEAAVFAKELAAEIEAARTRNEIESLVVMAAPSFLGLLNSELSEAAHKLLIDSVHKNLVKSSLEEIREHLPDPKRPPPGRA